MTKDNYSWTDNPTVSGVSKCDTDVLNDCLMHLKYNNTNKGGFDLFDIKITDHILIGEEAAGWVIQGGLVTMTYPAAVKVIKEEYADGVDYLEGDIAYRLSPSGRKIAEISQYDAIDEMCVTKGFAPFYILDSVNNQFYLPRNNAFIQFTDTISKLNSTVEAGLPNITADAQLQLKAGPRIGLGYSTGAIKTRGVAGVEGYGNGGSGQMESAFLFDASLSNSIYGKSETVQPSAVFQLLYYKVGDTVVNSNQALIDAQKIYDETKQEIINKANEGIERIKEVSTSINYTNVSNAILEAPQNIHVEINDLKQLVLKAGSKLLYPDSETKTFKELVVQRDYISNITTAAEVCQILCLNSDNEAEWGMNDGKAEELYYSNTAPTPSSQYGYWLNPETFECKYTNDTGATWLDYKFTLPFCLAVCTTEGYVSLDSVMNNFTFFGSYLYVRDGVRVLAPDGRNSDGTLKNRELVSGSGYDYSQDIASNTFDAYAFIGNQDESHKGNIVCSVITDYHYDSEKNRLKLGDESWTAVICGEVSVVNGKFVSLKEKGTLNLNNGHSVVETYRNGVSWYRIWSDGWIEQGSTTDGIGNGSTVTMLRSFSDLNYTLVGGLSPGGASGLDNWFSPYKISVNSWGMSAYKNWGYVCWYACGY